MVVILDRPDLRGAVLNQVHLADVAARPDLSATDTVMCILKSAMKEWPAQLPLYDVTVDPDLYLYRGLSHQAVFERVDSALDWVSFDDMASGVWRDKLQVRVGTSLRVDVKPHRPPEWVLERDGIVGHPDALSYLEILGEYKSTAMYKKKDAPQESYLTEWYLEQHKLYLYMLGWNEGRFGILHDANGQRPDLRIFQVQFTDDELEAAWETALRRRDLILKIRADAQLYSPHDFPWWIYVPLVESPRMETRKWECGNCPVGPKKAALCPGV